MGAQPDLAIPVWLNIQADCAHLTLYVQPGAKKTEILGLHGGALKLRVAALATDGRANVAVCVLIAGILGISVNKVSLQHGHKNRHKVLRIEAITAAVITQLKQLGSGP